MTTTTRTIAFHYEDEDGKMRTGKVNIGLEVDEYGQVLDLYMV